MAISFTYIDRETWMTYPRFWFRLAFSLFFGLMNFLYAVEYRMDFLVPTQQSIGLQMLLFFLIVAVVVSECVFHVQKAVEPIINRNIRVEQPIGLSWLLGQ